MTEIKRAFRSSALAATALAAMLAAGCSNAPREGGPDMPFLTASLEDSDQLVSLGRNLLPLTTGNQWQMRSVCEGKSSNDTLTVVGPATPPGGAPSIEVDALREGQPWRKEYYSDEGGKGIFITAMKDETSPLMVLSAPVPLVQYPLHQGQECSWQGTVSVGGKGSYPMSIVSRLSSADTVQTPAGRFKICRLDTIATMNADGHEVRFPTVRYFSPNVGFVQRNFADKGRPAMSELIKFNVR